MILQSASRKEISRITFGTLICDVILFAGLFLLSQFGFGAFEPLRILLSILCGSLIAIGNFTIMCLTIQSAVGMEDRKKMQAKFQLSYNARMIIQAAWIVGSFLIPQIHFVAGSAPVLFPKITILYLQFTGKLFPPSQPQAEDAAEEAPIPEESE